MRCQNCGNELQEGALFCRECGSRVEAVQFCRDCGAKIIADSRFCSHCGAPTNPMDSFKSQKQTNNSKPKENVNVAPPKTKLNLYAFLPIIAIGFGLLIAISIIGVVANQNMAKSDMKNKYVSLPESEVKKSKRDDEFDDDDYTYSYKSDEFNVYIAIPVSDNKIKIENWNKPLSNIKSYSYNYDVGTFKINDDDNGFYWVDDEHTMFVISFEDKKNSSHAGDYAPRIFTINISDNDKCKGTNYNKDIACYSFEHDDFHMYRAIVMSDNYIKIECWYKSIAFDAWQYGYVVCVFNTEDNNLDFEWGNDAFTVTMYDPEESYYWKGEEFVSFTLENDYKYEDVDSYINDADRDLIFGFL